MQRCTFKRGLLEKAQQIARYGEVGRISYQDAPNGAIFGVRPQEWPIFQRYCRIAGRYEVANGLRFVPVIKTTGDFETEAVSEAKLPCGGCSCRSLA